MDVAVDLEGSLVELRKHWNIGAMTRWWWCLRERENRGTREREQSGGGGDGEGGELGLGEEATGAGFIGGERGGVAGGDGAVAGGDSDVRALYGRGGRRPNRYAGCGPIRKEMG